MKKNIAIILIITMLLSLTACKKDSKNLTSTNNSDDIVKPEKISVIISDVHFNDYELFLKSFEDELSKELGIDIDIQAFHTYNYYDAVETAFNNDTAPDVLISNNVLMKFFATNGSLYDMTDLWDASELKNRCVENNVIDIVEGMKTADVKTGGKRLYTIPLEYSSTKVTYVRKSWLEECGLSAPKTYDEYYNMLLAFRNKYNTAPILRYTSQYVQSYPFISDFPQFFQNAIPYIYQNEEGIWVDGFAAENTKEALLRLQKAKNDGLLGKCDRVGAPYFGDPSVPEEVRGVVTYRNFGTSKVQNNLQDYYPEDELIALEPIEEMQAYAYEACDVISITSKCKNPEGVFKYFIEPMFDGGKVQALCTYGAKGVHWDNKAETITVKGKEYTYSEGEFHYLPLENEIYEDFLINPKVTYVPLKDEYNYGASLMAIEDKYVKIQNDTMEMLKNHCRYIPLPYPIDDNGINSYVKELIQKIVDENMSVEDAMKEYNETYGDKVKEVLDMLNSRE